MRGRQVRFIWSYMTYSTRKSNLQLSVYTWAESLAHLTRDTLNHPWHLLKPYLNPIFRYHVLSENSLTKKIGTPKKAFKQAFGNNKTKQQLRLPYRFPSKMPQQGYDVLNDPHSHCPPLKQHDDALTKQFSIL